MSIRQSLLKPAIIAASMAFVVAGCASTPSDESAGEYIDSAAITAKVKSELALSDDTSALQIEVETFKDVVQLSGFVDSADEKAAAGRIAADVSGVADVRNDLVVKAAGS